MKHYIEVKRHETGRGIRWTVTEIRINTQGRRLMGACYEMPDHEVSRDFAVQAGHSLCKWAGADGVKVIE